MSIWPSKQNIADPVDVNLAEATWDALIPDAYLQSEPRGLAYEATFLITHRGLKSDLVTPSTDEVFIVEDGGDETAVVFKFDDSATIADPFILGPLPLNISSPTGVALGLGFYTNSVGGVQIRVQTIVRLIGQFKR